MDLCYIYKYVIIRSVFPNNIINDLLTCVSVTYIVKTIKLHQLDIMSHINIKM